MDVTYPELALHPRSLAGVRYPHPSLEDTYQPGTTEPWIAQLVCSLLVASGGRTALETGGFQGITSAWLALTLERMGGGRLIVAEIESDRAAAIENRLHSLPALSGGCDVTCEVFAMDVMDVIRNQPNGSLDFVWLDDDHTKSHVVAEVEALWPKMRHNGLLVFHDVYGVTDLQAVVKRFGGYSLDLPRLGPAGGIGILQVR